MLFSCQNKVTNGLYNVKEQATRNAEKGEGAATQKAVGKRWDREWGSEKQAKKTDKGGVMRRMSRTARGGRLLNFLMKTLFRTRGKGHTNHKPRATHVGQLSWRRRVPRGLVVSLLGSPPDTIYLSTNKHTLGNYHTLGR